MYQKISHSLLFKLDPEQAHDLTIQLLRLSGILPPLRKLLELMYIAHSQYNSQQNPVKITKTTFPNQIGLAAGYDKNALAIKGLAALGFGHIEIGTVTPQPQDGNPKPRVFRIPEEYAIINRMGFPGKGAGYVAKQLSKINRAQFPAVIGVNIGKNKDTPNEEAVNDYLYLLEKFSFLADYLTVNVSSPNTIGLRGLQARKNLEVLLNQLAEKRSILPENPPIFVKLAPDLSDDALEDALAAIIVAKMDGVIATNTTIDHQMLKSPLQQEAGGLSGLPLYEKSLSMVRKIHIKTSGQLPIIGVGGIMNPDDAKKMLDSGADLVQIYTGFVYNGPGFVKEILRALDR